ncbi:MAG: protein kinase domain-containing protein [Isosphaeraceae bacterium]
MRQSADVGLTEDTEREVDSPPAIDPAARPAVASPSTVGTESGTDPVLQFLICWEEAYGRGEDPDPVTLCGDDPRWIGALKERIAKRKRLHALMDLPQSVGAAGPDVPLPEFPGHEVFERIGRGGMGVVYRARDVRLGRTVAIKTLAEARYAERDQVERFLDEARAVARLRHPNIVGIHAIGEHDGGTYLSLEYVEGGSLASRLGVGPMAPRPAAQLVATLAAAVDFAHRAGVVHRDLKPSNVLLTEDGVPKVGDFGLAKLLDADSARTFSGQVMGTPSYMAPEQAEGHSGRVGPTADVYALGAILYHALTGRPPFLGESALETIRLVTGTEAVPPTRLRPEIPRDLETICLKCLEKEPARRYASAAGLADDLNRFLDGRPILARPTHAAARLVRWTDRNRALAALSALLAAVCLLGTPGFFVLWLSARAERDRADDERAKAVAALVDTRRAREQAEAARGEANAALKRADDARARAISAIRNILLTEDNELTVEEARPYRRALTALGLHEAEELVRTLGNDPGSEMQLISGYMAVARLQLDAGQ